MEQSKILGAIENILFMAGEAVEVAELARVLGIPQETLDALLDEEIRRREAQSGLCIRRVAGGVQLCTRPEYAELIVEALGEKNEEALSRAMLETLSIIAYRQPVTREEVEQIRGVGSSYTIGALLEKGLIEEAGRKEALGRPKLYATSPAFLRYFDLTSLAELPPLPEAAPEETIV